MKKSILILVTFILLTTNQHHTLIAQEKIKMYIFYTPSHKILKDEWFIPSLKDDYEIISEIHDQQCNTGNFMENGWLNTMLHKVDLIIRAIHENWGKIFIHADVDIQWFKPTKNIILALMKNKDMVIQQDTPETYFYGKVCCAGFFACRGNEKTLKLWQAVRKNMLITPDTNDQVELNKLLKNSNQLGISWDFLPVEFFSGGTLTGDFWKPGNILPIPKGIYLHHGNWTSGVENKIKQLEYVRNEVMKRSLDK